MKTDSQRENLLLFSELYNRFSNLAVTRFDWLNLPDTVDERILNMGLYLQGTCAFFNHPDFGLIALPSTPGNQFNILYQPVSLTVFGYGYSKQLNDPSQFGIVRVSPTGVPLALTIYEYTKRMADILRSIDVLAQRMKRPYIFTVDEKQRMTFMNLFKNIKDNEEIILGLKDYPLDQSTFDVAPLPYQGDLEQLWKSYHEYERLLYKSMGVNTLDETKKERMIVDEATSNEMVIELANEVNLKELTLCIDDVNEKFGTNIGVEIKEVSSFNKNGGFSYTGGENNG